MVFSSISFLFFFLPAVLILYALAGKFRNALLLVASLLFYSWGEGFYVLTMLASILVNYWAGRALGLVHDRRRLSRLILAVAVLANFGLLAFCKYTGFLVDTCNSLLAVFFLPPVVVPPVHLPIGISFFTFQAVSYLIDVSRRTIAAQRQLTKLALYIALFSQLIAGPIVRYRDIAGEIEFRRVSSEDLAAGIQRFIFGLAKKVLLANPLALLADKLFALPANELSLPLAWLAAICYTLQIYYDFSGYSDMAIGLGRMFGFHFLENFRYPYISCSIQEFWQRWHISLSSWFRDYLYIPLGGSRQGTLRTYRNLLIVFFLCGLWHGASWTFVVWGLFHGFFLVLERLTGERSKRLLPRWVQHLLTLTVVVCGWVIFRCDSLFQAGHHLTVMFGAGAGGGWQTVGEYLNGKSLTELVVAFSLAMPLWPRLGQWSEGWEAAAAGVWRMGLQAGTAVGRLSLLGLLLYLTLISLAAGVYNPFIYFRF